jgi:hypothetical protein
MNHPEAINVPTYPYEFNPLLKLVNHALMNESITQHLTIHERHIIYAWLDDFQFQALEHAHDS